MAETKPHEATPNWIRRAKREGNVARSQELSSLAAVSVGALAIAGMLPLFGAIDAAWIERTAADRTVHVENALPLLGVLGAVLLCAGGGGVIASLLQEPPFFVFPKLKADRLNPAEGVKRMFSPEAAISALRALLAFGLAGWALVPTAYELFARGLGVAPLAFYVSLAASAATRIVFAVVGIAAFFAIFDVILVRHRWRKKLRMSHYELKRDLRESEGDPTVRRRRRRMHRRLNMNALDSVKKAAFVVTNPTRIAIALDYRPPEVAVPRILVRAADETAHRVRTLAAQACVPLIENVPLARELYERTDVGDEIPIESYVAVAEIVNALLRQGALA